MRGAGIAFGDKPLFEALDLQIGRRDRLCLIGRNGSGKTTLMRLLAGEIELDSGERVVAYFRA